MGLPRNAASVLLSSLGLVGCSALLGTFEVSDSGQEGGVGEGGGSDGPVTTEAGDAPTDAPIDAALLLLKCTPGQIRTIAVALPKAGDNRPPQFDELQIFHIDKAGGNSRVRIVSRPTQSPGFTVYDFEPNNPSGTVATLDIPANSGISAVHRLANAIGILGTSNAAGGLSRLDLHRIPDSSLSDVVIPLAAPGTLSTNSPPGSRGPHADFAVIGNVASPDYYYAYTSPLADTGPFELKVGRANNGTPVGPNLIFTSNDVENPASVAGIIAGPSQVILPLQQQQNGPPTVSDQVINASDNALGVTAIPRSVEGVNKKPNIFFGGGPSKGSTGINMAYLELDVASVTAPITYRLGSIPLTKIGSYTADDIPVAFTFDSVTRIVADGGTTGWLDDHFLAIGRGQGLPGLNFVWYDAAAKVLRANHTGPDAILKDKPEVRRAAITFSQTPLPIFAQFDMAWTQSTTVAGDSSVTETLYYTSVGCVR